MSSKSSICPRLDALVASKGAGLRIGIMGGTFDPIHYGHLICAEQAREQFELDLVIFLPAGNPSFKRDKKITDAEDRYAMVHILTEKNPTFDVSRIEIDREGITYTYDTLRELRSELPDDTELFFITGADAIVDLPKWYKASELASMAHFVAATRPGYDYSDFKRALEEDTDDPFDVSFFEVPSLDISSTDLRNRFAQGRSVLYMTPMSVARYVESHGLYQGGE